MVGFKMLSLEGSLGDELKKTSEKPKSQGAEYMECETGAGPDFVRPKRSTFEMSDTK